MAKNNTGGNTQNTDGGEKTSKPKPIMQVTMTVRDDGKIAGDFWVWEEDELGRRKKWTVSGEDAMKFLKRVQPNNIRILASALNVQVVLAGLPETDQGPKLTVKDGRLALAEGTLGSTASPVGNGAGERLAGSAEAAQATEIGLKPQG